MDRITDRILFLGAGNMAQAIIDGISESGVVERAMIGVVDPDPDKRAQFDNAFAEMDAGVRWVGECAGSGGIIILAVKPQMLEAATKGMPSACEMHAHAPLVISILAGIKSKKISESIGESARVVRVMPNMAASISKGMSAISLGPGADDDDARIAGVLFNAIGRVIRIEEEMMDAFTGLAGSGPAYLFYLAEGMERAAIEMGFTQDDASIIVNQTLHGSACLLSRLGERPSTLRERVTSKGGTTAAGIDALEHADAMGAITRAVLSARNRGVELGGQ